MGIIEVVNNIKINAMSIPTANMASFGDISLYDNKATIKYPYVNIDVVNNKVTNNSNKTYTFRIYVCDRNEPYVAYNKAELILDSLLNQLQIENYSTNYFTLNFQDIVNGVWADIIFESNVDLACPIKAIGESGYVILENSDFIRNFLLKEDDGKIEIE